MNVQKVQSKIIPALEMMEGAGVKILRTIGSRALRNLDPFLLLDQISSDSPDDYLAGFPSHPHRGFNTFTYMIDGAMEHKDSMGNCGNIGPGDAQWMKAASGVIHSEMPQQQDGLLRGFQLWINLPAAHKLELPDYQEYNAAAFPVVENSDYSVKVIIGRLDGFASPIVDEFTNVSFFDVQLKPNKLYKISLPQEHNSFLYLFEGSGNFKGQAHSHNMSSHQLLTLGNGNIAEFIAGEQGARFLLVSGRPINEPIVQFGPFVMNTSQEIDQARHDYQSNNLLRNGASTQL